MTSADKESQGKTINLPYFGIQCDWDEALSRIDGKVWISVRQPGQQQSIHGHLQRKGAEIIGTEPFEVVKDKITKHSITVRDQNSGNDCSFVAPYCVFDGIHKKSVRYLTF